MDWLRKLPVVGPLVGWLTGTHAWRSYERLDRVKWARLAAAMTFISFVALFPLLTVAAAIAAATLSESRQHSLQNKIADQFPGISDQLDIRLADDVDDALETMDEAEPELVRAEVAGQQ